MALKCRCICGCKLLVSAGSAGKRIKCPKCERKLRVPVDLIEKRRAQVESRKADAKAETTPAPQASRIESPLSSLIDIPDPTPPPLQSESTKPRLARDEPESVAKDADGELSAEGTTNKEVSALRKIPVEEPKQLSVSPNKPLKHQVEAVEEEGIAKKQTLAPEAEVSQQLSLATDTEALAPAMDASDNLQLDDSAVETSQAKKPKTPPPLPTKLPKRKQESVGEAVVADRLAPTKDEVAPQLLSATDAPVTASAAETPEGESPSKDSSVEADLPTKPPARKPIPSTKDADAERQPSTEIQTAPRLLPATETDSVMATTDEPAAPIAALLPEETEDAEVPVVGYVADRDKVATVRWLAATILLTAVIGMVPAMIDIVEHTLSDSSEGLSYWASALLLISMLQFAYAVYLIQLPDWSSIWVVTVFTVGVAAGYAAMLGLTLLSSDQGHFVQLLDLADRIRGGKAAAWCLIMLGLLSLTGYFSGRIATRWRSDFVG